MGHHTSQATAYRFVPAPYEDSVEQGRILLKDGSVATVRPATAADRDALRVFIGGLSRQSLQHRFFSGAVPSDSVLDSLLLATEPAKRLTLFVTRQEAGAERIIAVGSYFAVDPNTAEVALAVIDAFHGRGLGTQLLERLALLAVRHGFETFWAVTATENDRMIDVLRHSGFRIQESAERGVLEFRFALAPTAETVRQSEIRDQIATCASLRPFFRPRSVAVVGASRNPSSIGFRLVEALVRARFEGPVYPVNPAASSIASIPCHATLGEIPDSVDLAILAVPRDSLLDAVRDCSRKGVRALVVITAGFAECGPEGLERERQLVDLVRGSGMRMVGPNCLGLINADPAVRLNASFSPIFPDAGAVALSSQSGALGLAILELARQRGMGVSTFVSIGNKADVSSNDLLQYWELDEQTRTILLYLESFGNPRRFARIAKRVSRTKPIVALKAGRTPAGRRAAGSHTASLASSDAATEALFHQTGVIRAQTIDEMFDMAAMLSSQPLPAGSRVGILTNAGGPAILCADACEVGRLNVPRLSDDTQRLLRGLLPSSASVQNPIDMIASAGPDAYRAVIEALLPNPEIDSLIVIYTPVDRSQEPDVIAAILDGIRLGRSRSPTPKPVLACMLAHREGARVLHTGNEMIPCYPFPEVPGRVLAAAASYARWRSRPAGNTLDFQDVDLDKASGILQKYAGREAWLSPADTQDVLACFLLPTPPSDTATTPDDAALRAERIGFPIALKAIAPSVVHKTDVGAVRLDLRSTAEVREACAAMLDTLNGRVEGFFVQAMVGHGVELVVGVSEEPAFGHLVGFGLGGTRVEVLNDIVFRIAPLTDRDADEMMASIRGRRLLEGFRGQAAADTAALREILLRVSQLVEEFPQIKEIDFNPVLALDSGQGAWIVDARVRVR